MVERNEITEVFGLGKYWHLVVEAMLVLLQAQILAHLVVVEGELLVMQTEQQTAEQVLLEDLNLVKDQ